jgi:hypothetical protein
MNVRTDHDVAPWLLLTFSLPAKKASQRVEVWRLLQRYGVVPLGNSGYLLPNRPANRERFHWLSSTIRSYKGEASVVDVRSIDNLSKGQLVARFNEARAREYRSLIKDIERVSCASSSSQTIVKLGRISGRFQEIMAIDFFHNPLQKHVADLLTRLQGTGAQSLPEHSGRSRRRDYLHKMWVTRPKPGIDRSASAWFILRFIDSKARFVFAEEGQAPPASIPFDMFHGGFGHRGDDSTFETLQKEFRVRDSKVSVIGQMIHDADLDDGKYGRKEAFGIDEVLKGWAKQGMPDKEILAKGVAMIDGLYQSLS